MTLVDHQILGRGCGDTSNEERRFTLKDLHLRTVRTVSVFPLLLRGLRSVPNFEKGVSDKE